MSVPTLERVRQTWDTFAPAFSANWTLSTSESAHTLAVMSNLASAENVLEVGTGAGLGTQLILLLKGRDTKIVSIDLSVEFLKIARERIGDAVDFQEGNAESLSFAEGTFDRYIANFVLHLTPDPVAMLKEARRVLKSGGIAGFSVWGTREQSPHFTLPALVAKEMDIDMNCGEPPARSNFHLGEDLETVRKMALEAGFSKAYSWYQKSPIDAWTAESWVDRQLEGPNYKKVMAMIGEEKAAAYRKRLTERADEILKSGQPISYETLFLFAEA